ncbi:hypothetical protein [Novosphingobium rosa]|uniref:hypothetical protein n=1 Tax=Novosphingobium rosa TaxID=76978 RepID=UPI0008302D47|nr:hypothetical protein [Novosphingobium rosa]
MVERASASITIGGNLAARLLPQFTALVMDQGLSLEWDGDPFVPGDSMSGAPLRLMAHEVAFGQFGMLEGFCVNHRLPFVRWSDRSIYSRPQRCIFTGSGQPRSYRVDEGGSLVMDRRTVIDLGSFGAIIAWFRQGSFMVPSLRIIGDPNVRGG